MKNTCSQISFQCFSLPKMICLFRSNQIFQAKDLTVSSRRILFLPSGKEPPTREIKLGLGSLLNSHSILKVDKRGPKSFRNAAIKKEMLSRLRIILAQTTPIRFVSRQILIDWKAQLDYDFVPGIRILERISSTKVGFMDLKEINSEASLQLFMDILAGEKSILRKVFGQAKRFQPNKPSTKAQAAVALASGRMTEAISAELSRLQLESSARKAEMEDIKLELLERGHIQRSWEKKLNEEKERLFEVEKLYLAAVSDLEGEKMVQEKLFSEYFKEMASMDCQRQLLLSLKEEVDGMTVKFASERSVCEAEQCELHNMQADLQTQLEGMLDIKSVLEAEKEALRILRSWVEDEARKSQARAKVLEEVGRRWKWDDQA